MDLKSKEEDIKLGTISALEKVTKVQTDNQMKSFQSTSVSNFHQYP